MVEDGTRLWRVPRYWRIEGVWLRVRWPCLRIGGAKGGGEELFLFSLPVFLSDICVRTWSIPLGVWAVSVYFAPHSSRIRRMNSPLGIEGGD